MKNDVIVYSQLDDLYILSLNCTILLKQNKISNEVLDLK